MGTRSRIGILNEDASIISIYCHWDGYPAHHGPILLQHYDSEDKTRALMALGDLSSLGGELGEKHKFEDRRQRNWCTAYLRDRNDKGCEARTSINHNAFYALAHDCDAEYLYVLGTPMGMPEPCWWVCKAPSHLRNEHYWKPLNDRTTAALLRGSSQ